jgi:hypothetical protein
MSEIAKPSKVNAVKAHFKRNQKRYIFGAGLAAGIVVTGYVAKSFQNIVPVITDGPRSFFVMPGTPIKIEATEANVEAFNKVVDLMRQGQIIHPSKNLLFVNAPKDVLAKNNWVVMLINDFVKAHPEVGTFNVNNLVPLNNQEF